MTPATIRLSTRNPCPIKSIRAPIRGEKMPMYDFIPFGSKIEQAGNQAHNNKQHGGNPQYDRQFFWFVEQIADGLERRVRRYRIGPNSRQNVSGFGAPGTQRGAIAAVVAQPDIAVAQQLVLQPPGSRNHLFSWEGLVVR